MAATKYTYSISTDFPNGVVATDRLTVEIQDSTIITALDYINTSGDDCDIWFKAAISAGDETTLNGIVAAHSGEPLPYMQFDANGNLITTMPYTTSASYPIVTMLDIPETASNLHQSWETQVAPETTTYKYIHINGELTGTEGRCWLQKGAYICRTDAAENSALHLAIRDRDDTLGLFVLYGLVTTKITGVSVLTGTIGVGDYVEDESGNHSHVLTALDAGAVHIMYHDGALDTADTLTFKDATTMVETATATFTAWVEGDALELKRPVKDEYIEGYDSEPIAPGGATAIIQGLYLCIIVYNASTTDDLRLTMRFSLGME